jgi:hypothetical protein
VKKSKNKWKGVAMRLKRNTNKCKEKQQCEKE